MTRTYYLLVFLFFVRVTSSAKWNEDSVFQQTIGDCFANDNSMKYEGKNIAMRVATVTSSGDCPPSANLHKYKPSSALRTCFLSRLSTSIMDMNMVSSYWKVLSGERYEGSKLYNFRTLASTLTKQHLRESVMKAASKASIRMYIKELEKRHMILHSLRVMKAIVYNKQVKLLIGKEGTSEMDKDLKGCRPKKIGYNAHTRSDSLLIDSKHCKIANGVVEINKLHAFYLDSKTNTVYLTSLLLHTSQELLHITDPQMDDITLIDPHVSTCSICLLKQVAAPTGYRLRLTTFDGTVATNLVIKYRADIELVFFIDWQREDIYYISENKRMVVVHKSGRKNKLLIKSNVLPQYLASHNPSQSFVYGSKINGKETFLSIANFSGTNSHTILAVKLLKKVVIVTCSKLGLLYDNHNFYLYDVKTGTCEKLYSCDTNTHNSNLYVWGQEVYLFCNNGDKLQIYIFNSRGYLQFISSMAQKNHLYISK